jgi:hypothetical protein
LGENGRTRVPLLALTPAILINLGERMPSDDDQAVYTALRLRAQRRARAIELAVQMGLTPQVAADAIDRALAQVEAQTGAERPSEAEPEPPDGGYLQP